MQLIHGPGYSQQERESYREIVFSNVVQAMKTILEAMEVLKIELGDADHRKYATTLTGLPQVGSLALINLG